MTRQNSAKIMQFSPKFVYRIQDKKGRGPYRPGFSSQWVEDRDDHDNLFPWYQEFGPIHQIKNTMRFREKQTAERGYSEDRTV
jgi:hypothetical protein